MVDRPSQITITGAWIAELNIFKVNHAGSKDNPLRVGELELLLEVGLPGGTHDDHVGGDPDSEQLVEQDWGGQEGRVVQAGVSSRHTFDILTVAQQQVVVLEDLIGGLLPVIDGSQEHEGSHDYEQPGRGIEGVSGERPGDVAEGVLDKAYKIPEEPPLISPVDGLAPKPELLEFPIKLFAHGAIDHFEALNPVGSSVIEVVVSVVPELDSFLDGGVAHPEVVAGHFVMGRHPLI